jgi:hypothetical protein
VGGGGGPHPARFKMQLAGITQPLSGQSGWWEVGSLNSFRGRWELPSIDVGSLGDGGGITQPFSIQTGWWEAELLGRDMST